MTDGSMTEGDYLSSDPEIAPIQMVGEDDGYRSRRQAESISRVRFRAEKPKRGKKRSMVLKPPREVHHPKTDAEAIAIIERLGTYQWETHKVSGRFVANPYSITTIAAGKFQTIVLPGRFGSVLKYLEVHTR